MQPWSVSGLGSSVKEITAYPDEQGRDKVEIGDKNGSIRQILKRHEIK